LRLTPLEALVSRARPVLCGNKILEQRFEPLSISIRRAPVPGFESAIEVSRFGVGKSNAFVDMESDGFQVTRSWPATRSRLSPLARCSGVRASKLFLHGPDGAKGGHVAALGNTADGDRHGLE
jgi:hypothetical protein